MSVKQLSLLVSRQSTVTWALGRSKTNWMLARPKVWIYGSSRLARSSCPFSCNTQLVHKLLTHVHIIHIVWVGGQSYEILGQRLLGISYVTHI